MPDPLTRRLGRLLELDTAERQAIAALVGARVRHLDAGEEILADGALPLCGGIVLDGWMIRSKLLPDGRRPITAILVPGDVLDLDCTMLWAADHAVSACTSVAVAEIGRDAAFLFSQQFPRLGRALQWEAVVALSIQREWTVNVGQRTAFERFAHVFCELLLRLRAAGLAPGDRFDLPMTQADLGDAMGVSTVHANRILQELRHCGLIHLEGRLLTIPNYARLARAGLFDPAYLHLEGWRPDCGRTPDAARVRSEAVPGVEARRADSIRA